MTILFTKVETMNNLDRFYKLKENYENIDDIWIDHISRLEAISDCIITHICCLWVIIIFSVIIGLMGVVL